MRQRNSSHDLELLKREAKQLRRGATSLTHQQALDQVAERHGWPNWALAQRNAIAPHPSDVLRLSVKDFRGGDRGVFLLKLQLVDKKAIDQLARTGGLRFELPAAPPRWIVRRFTAIGDVRQDPFLSRAGESVWVGQFDGDTFLCVLSTNGVQPSDVEQEISETLLQLAAAFKAAAVAALCSWLGLLGAGVRLFFISPNGNGVDALHEASCDTVASAQARVLPASARPIGILSPQGWWTHQRQFGWTPPVDPKVTACGINAAG